MQMIHKNVKDIKIYILIDFYLSLNYTMNICIEPFCCNNRIIDFVIIYQYVVFFNALFHYNSTLTEKRFTATI